MYGPRRLTFDPNILPNSAVKMSRSSHCRYRQGHILRADALDSPLSTSSTPETVLSAGASGWSSTTFPVTSLIILACIRYWRLETVVHWSRVSTCSLYCRNRMSDSGLSGWHLCGAVMTVKLDNKATQWFGHNEGRSCRVWVGAECYNLMCQRVLVWTESGYLGGRISLHSYCSYHHQTSVFSGITNILFFLACDQATRRRTISTCSRRGGRETWATQGSERVCGCVQFFRYRTRTKLLREERRREEKREQDIYKIAS